MKWLLLMLISLTAVILVTAQEKFSSDSLIIRKQAIKVDRQIVAIPMNFDEIFSPKEFDLIDNSFLHQPLLPDYTKNLDLSRFLSSSKLNSYSFNPAENFSYQVFPFGQVFNQSTFQLSDHFMIGGNSFGARSVFEPPKINSSIQDMMIKGASMFVQYKFSDHFKVQTRVSISNHKGMPFEP